jgi:hypothetical protein
VPAGRVGSVRWPFNFRKLAVLSRGEVARAVQPDQRVAKGVPDIAKADAELAGGALGVCARSPTEPAARNSRPGTRMRRTWLAVRLSTSRWTSARGSISAAAAKRCIPGGSSSSFHVQRGEIAHIDNLQTARRDQRDPGPRGDAAIRGAHTVIVGAEDPGGIGDADRRALLLQSADEHLGLRLRPRICRGALRDGQLGRDGRSARNEENPRLDT